MSRGLMLGAVIGTLLVGGITEVVIPVSSAGAEEGRRGLTVLYVDVDAPGPVHDGSSWGTAFIDLQDALGVAGAGTTIRVADGTYTPDRGTGDRTATFQLLNGVTLEGGCAGCGAVDPDGVPLAILLDEDLTQPSTRDECEPVGGFLQPFVFPRRYRGIMLHVTDPAELREFSVELSITGQVDLYFSIHVFVEDGGCFHRLIDDVVVPVNGHGRDFYSSGLLTDSQGGPLFLDPGDSGLDYALGVAWGSASIIYGRDGLTYPQPFSHGSIRGSVSASLSSDPPIDPKNEGICWTPFAFGAYSMELCFAPEEGACCLPDSTCENLDALVCVQKNGAVLAGEACDADTDGDGIFELCGDNCPNDHNPDQENCNNNASGDACEEECGNGVLETACGEDCEPPGSECCDASCHFEPADTMCTDDGNPCTDDVCDGAGTCEHRNNSASHCDDGMFCNGEETCLGGVCVDGPDPCGEATICDEDKAECTCLPYDMNGDGFISIFGDATLFATCVYMGVCACPGLGCTCPGDCNCDGVLSIAGDVPCFVDCVYYGNCDVCGGR